MPRDKKVQQNDTDNQERLSWAEESKNEEVNKTEELFNREKAVENEDKKVSECSEAELLEVLWKRGNDNLNIALHKGVEKLYRMLRGDRLHPPSRERYNNRGRGRRHRVTRHHFNNER